MLRDSWKNCARETDEEIVAIDAMEDEIQPLDEETLRIRRLITSLELCHHKAERWVELTVRAIASGKASRGPVGTRPPGRRHPVEDVWDGCCQLLSTWARQEPLPAIPGLEEKLSGREVEELLGRHTPLKEWQVERVFEKIRSMASWAQHPQNPAARYCEIVENEQRYEDAEEFRQATMQVIIHDTIDGEQATVSLAGAIDHLEPCHWNFLQNLRIVLGAIGGDYRPDQPFGACNRNRKQTPIRESMMIIATNLQAYAHNSDKDYDEMMEADQELLDLLGPRTPVKAWLTTSLD